MGFIKFLFKSVDATIETKKTVKDISNNASYCNGLFTDDIVSPETKSQGLFHQIHKEVTFCGLPHGADA